MEYNITTYFLLFMIYSVAGWIMEVICTSINAKKFVNRGFLIGPYCPIYGCGAIIITLFLRRYLEDWIILFFMSVIICGLLEYLTSYIMEKLFHARWWDYSNKKYNINGRICLETLIPFGILGLIIMYITNPLILGLLGKVPMQVLSIITIILCIIFGIDFVISTVVISNVRTTSTKLEKGKGVKAMDNTEEITAKVKEILLKKSILHRRLIHAYPNLRATIKKKQEEIKQKTEEFKGDIEDIKQDIKNKVKKDK